MLTISGVKNFGKMQSNSFFHKLAAKAIVRQYVDILCDENIVHTQTIQNGKIMKHLHKIRMKEKSTTKLNERPLKS